LSGTATSKGSMYIQVCGGDPSAQSVEKKLFTLHFSVVWIGSRNTFALCTALLTAEYAEC